MALCIFYFVIFFSIFFGTLGVLRPRGVPLPSKIFYNPSEKFNCLDGSGSFPFHFVNDDFCDCEDGSDEPGTSACLNGIFYCLNHGYVSKILPSSQINDGICDCCDTTDEYNSTADCLNNCKELGQEALRNAIKLRDTFKKAQEIRNDYIKIGKEKKEEYKSLLDEFYKQEKKAMKDKNEKQDAKENAETKENVFLGKEREFKEAQKKRIAAEKRLLFKHQQKEENEGRKAFAGLDVNADGKLTISELKSFVRFDYDGDGVVSENEAKFYMQKKDEMTLEEFITSGWKIIKPAFTIEEIEEESFETPKALLSDVLKNEEEKGEQVSNLVIDQTEKEAVLKEATLARKEYADADKLLRDIQAEIWHLKRKLNADFGDDDEFLILENQCFELSDKKYLYKICPFDKIVQVVKVNKDENLIGLWDRWNGPPDDLYEKMKFSRGTSCWNGPNRSAEVILRCGEENKVISVTETSPCTYVFEFDTPAYCKKLPPHVNKILMDDLIFV